MGTAQVEAISGAMQGKVLDGNAIISWSKRQPKQEDETAAERKRRQRDTQRSVTDSHDMSRDVPESHEASRPVTIEERRGDKRREDKKPTPTDSHVPRDPRPGPDPRVVEVAEMVCAIAGADSTTHANWHMIELVVARWMAAGCTEAIIDAAVREVMASRTEPPNSPAYFQPAVYRLRDAAKAGTAEGFVGGEKIDRTYFIDGEPPTLRWLKAFPDRASQLGPYEEAHGTNACRQWMWEQLDAAGLIPPKPTGPFKPREDAP
jgi:hypothetical protein